MQKIIEKVKENKFDYCRHLQRTAFLLLAIFCAANLSFAVDGKIYSISSPNKRVKVNFRLNEQGMPVYSLSLVGKQVLLESKLGLVRSDADFSKNLRLVSVSKPERVSDRYEILTAKRRLNEYLANRIVIHLATSDEKKLDIIFQVSNDGTAFRYHFPETDSVVYKLSDESTTFHFEQQSKAWLQPMSVAKSGWEKSNPSYEEYYEKEIPVGTPSKLGAGWVYPALFRTLSDVWVVISETALGRNYCGTRLAHESKNGEYKIAFADPRENFQGGAVNPESNLPWATPWRIIAVGSLKTVAESMLGVDLADKKQFNPTVKPGKSAWSWVLLGDDKTEFETQKKFIDYAAEMNWQYCLIDSTWDKQIGYEKLKELVDYAKTKNVKILLWYNSAGDWNTTPLTPRDRMLTHESRIKEFELLKKIGVAGLKIDFFGGDGQSMINYYHDILEDSAKYDFAINFHGATLPRGWQRRYPHLMTMESIRGFEFVTFEQANADQEPTHAAIIPFTRNVFDLMDFTPVSLDRVNDRIKRRTTSAFELALSVLFTSGVQHYAEIPSGMARVPEYVRNFLKRVPGIWEDVKFLDGYPGKFVVMARKGDDRRWYIAGINGEETEKKITLDLGDFKNFVKPRLITDGDDGNLSFREENIRLPKNKKLEITIKPKGGFVIVEN